MTTANTAHRSRTYRATATLWSAIGLTVGGAVFVVIGITTTRPGQIAGFVIGALLLLAGWRMWHVGIQATGDGVKVVTFLLSRRVAWQEIDHFAVLPVGRYPYVGYVVLRSGRKFGTFGLSTSARATEQSKPKIQRPIDELNKALADWREAAGKAGP